MTALRIEEKRDKAYRKVYDEATSIDELIPPTDLVEDAGSWGDVPDEKIDDEIHQSVDIIMSEGQYDYDIDGLAISEWVADMPRVNIDDMVFEDYDEALRNQYQPNKIGFMAARYRVRDMVDSGDLTIPQTARNKARNLIKQAIAHKLDPRKDGPER